MVVIVYIYLWLPHVCLDTELRFRKYAIDNRVMYNLQKNAFNTFASIMQSRRI